MSQSNPQSPMDIVNDYFVANTPTFRSEPLALLSRDWRKSLKVHTLRMKNDVRNYLLGRWLHARFRITYRFWFRLWAWSVRERHKKMIYYDL